jgi:hypothetical protein
LASRSTALLPRRFRSSARWRTPAVRVGLPTGYVVTKSDARCTACWRGIRTVLISDSAITAHADPEKASLAAAGRAVQRLTMDQGNLR